MAQQVRRVHDPLRQRRQLPVQLVEDLHEDRDEEHQHPRQHEEREGQHHDRVDHRALHAPLDLRVLLDLVRDPVEHRVQRSRRLARLDHRHVEPREHARVTGQRLRQDRPRLDVRAHLGDHRREGLVVGLLLEDQQRRDDADARLDQRRELAGEDLERLRLDLLRLPAAGGGLDLAQPLRNEPVRAELLLRGLEVGGVQLPLELEPLRVDRRVGERSHAASSIGIRVRPL